MQLRSDVRAGGDVSKLQKTKTDEYQKLQDLNFKIKYIQSEVIDCMADISNKTL